MSQENLNKIYGNVLVAETLSAARDLDKFDTGKVFILTGDGYTVNLPSAADAGEGWNCKFIVQDAGGAADYVIAAASGIVGHIVSADGNAGVSSTNLLAPGASVISEVGANSVGDTFTILCQGSLFVVQGSTAVTAAASFG